MESSWGKEAMKFARREIPALLGEYKDKPEGFFSALDKRWKDWCKVLAKRIEKLPKDDEAEGGKKPTKAKPDAKADTAGPKK